MSAPSVIFHDKFHSDGLLNEQVLMKSNLTRPDQITPILTHLMGKDEKKFPLTFLTEGMGKTKYLEIQDVEYYWNVMGRRKTTSLIVSHGYSSSDHIGNNKMPIYLVMEDSWLIEQHKVKTPNGIQLRVEKKEPLPNGNFVYTFRLIDPSVTEVPYAEIMVGIQLSQFGAANVSQSGSKGNNTNYQTPGKVKNQISIMRKSVRWEGNISKRVAEVQFDLPSGRTNMFMPFFMWQANIEAKQMIEEDLWFSKYNRKADGTIDDIDQDTGKPIPIGAGVEDQIPNVDTFSTLTTRRLKNTIRDIMYGATDISNMNVVLYTGTGGMDDFDACMKAEMGNYTQIVGDKFITGSGRNLMIGGFFTSWQHIDGHVVTLARLPVLDDLSGYARNAPRHPISGLPICSHDMYFLDQTTYDGVPNVQMVTQKGRGMVMGIVKGMAALEGSLPGMDFTGNANGFEMLATEEDTAALHALAAKGIMINRNTHCFKLKCTIS